MACLVWKDFKVGHYVQIFPSNYFVQAMFIGTIYFLRFKPLSVTLTIVAGHKINLLTPFSHTLFKLQIGMKLMWH